MKRASEVPPEVESSGVRPVTSAMASTAIAVNGPGLVMNTSAFDGCHSNEKLTRLARRGFRALFDQRFQRTLAVAVVVADVETRTRLTRNEVDGLVADIHRRKFKMRRIEMIAAPVERLRRQAADQPHQPRDRIVGAVRIGHVTLPAAHYQRAVERAAPAGLDGVADGLDVARLAEDAMIESFAAPGRPLQQLHGAVDGYALFVAGDEQRQRAVRGPAAVGGEVVERRGDKTGHAAFHVDDAAAVQPVFGNCAGERRMMPRRFVAWRNYIGMAGEHQVRRPAADPRVEIFHRRGSGLRESLAINAEARFRQHVLQIAERSALVRRHRPAADQIAGYDNGICGHSRYAPSCTASRLFCRRTHPGIKNASIRTQNAVISRPMTVIERMSCVTATPVRPR